MEHKQKMELSFGIQQLNAYPDRIFLVVDKLLKLDEVDVNYPSNTPMNPFLFVIRHLSYDMCMFMMEFILFTRKDNFKYSSSIYDKKSPYFFISIRYNLSEKQKYELYRVLVDHGFYLTKEDHKMIQPMHIRFIEHMGLTKQNKQKNGQSINVNKMSCL